MLANRTNLGKGKTAASTPSKTGFAPHKAVDGNTSTAFRGNLIINSDGGYWKLDLGVAVPAAEVARIVVHGNPACAQALQCFRLVLKDAQDVAVYGYHFSGSTVKQNVTIAGMSGGWRLAAQG